MDKTKNVVDNTDGSMDDAIDTTGGAVNQSAEDADVDSDDLGTGIDDELPQKFTESYGTGVREIPGYSVDENRFYDDDRKYNEASPTLTGGDIEANYEQANAEGDESVGGTAPTPDMDIVDNLGKAVGLEMNDANFLHTNDILEQRDSRRWELEPRSSQDYEERREDLDD
jgi:Family of unknown function (DUF6335)